MVLAYEHLAGAEFAVGDALGVGRVQDVEQFQADARGPYVVERALLREEFAQRRAVDPLVDGPQGAGLLGGVDDRGDPARAQQRHVLGRAQQPGGGPAPGLERVVRKPDLGDETRPRDLAGAGVLGIPADAVGLALDDLEQPVPAGDELVCGDVRPAHGHPSTGNLALNLFQRYGE